MAGQLRVLRRRIRTVQQTKQITKAMELVATSRIAKAQQRVEAALPYTNELTRALTALASNATTDHPLLVERPEPHRAAVAGDLRPPPDPGMGHESARGRAARRKTMCPGARP